MGEFEQLLVLFIAALILAAAARRVGAPYPVFLAIGGALLAFLPGAPSVTFPPELALALFVAPVLVLLSYVIGPAPMNLQFWPGAVVMMLIATMTASLVTNSGRSAWFVGVLVLMVYLIFAMTLYLLPPRSNNEDTVPRKTTERSTHRAYDEVKFTSRGATAPERSPCCASFS